MRFGFTTTHCFLVNGSGLVITPGIGLLDPPLCIGDRLRFMRPDGTQLETEVKLLQFVMGADPNMNPFLVLPGFQPSDVPPSTEVWVEPAN